MRTDNRNVKNTIISIYFLLLVFIILWVTVFKSYGMFPDSSIYVFLAILVVAVVFHFVARYFEYDSDGLKLVIINKGLILTEFINYRQNKIEVAKHKLIGYKIHDYLIYKTLVILLKNSEGHTYKERFNITLLKRKKLKYVKQSLRRMIKKNNSINKDQ
jgi:hypothetical protein